MCTEIVEITIDDILGSSESEDENIPDIKDIDIVLHPICQDSIKIEILEAAKTKVYMETENAHFMNIENNVTESENLNKAADTRYRNGSNATEGVAKIEGNLVTDKQHALKIFTRINCISARSRKPKETESHRTDENTSWKEIKEKIKVIKAPNIPVEPHEYTTLAKNHHVCNHCQLASKNLSRLKVHIKTIHRKTVKMYQCPYCPHKSKSCIRKHIILMHISCFRYRCDLCNYETKYRQCMENHKLNHLKPEDIPYFYCYHCSYKSKQKGHLKNHIIARHFKNGETEPKEKKYCCDLCNYETKYRQRMETHKLNHLKPEDIPYFYCYYCSHKYKQKGNLKNHIIARHAKNGETKPKEKKYRCDLCNYESEYRQHMETHKLNHLKPEDIPYFYCYHCSYKTKQKCHLKNHIIARHFKNGETKPKEKKYSCDQCGYKSDKPYNIKNHKLIHLKPEESQYFYCDHCSFKSRHQKNLKRHIFILHNKNVEIKQKRFSCDHCDFKTPYRQCLKKHNLIHVKPEDTQYFYCSHCSFKTKHKSYLRTHILWHFIKEEVKFHCYICDFMTFKRKSIVNHIKKHSKGDNKSKINKGS